MVKYQIMHGKHYVYSYADKTWHNFNSREEAFDFMERVIGG